MHRLQMIVGRARGGHPRPSPSAGQCRCGHHVVAVATFPSPRCGPSRSPPPCNGAAVGSALAQPGRVLPRRLHRRPRGEPPRRCRHGRYWAVRAGGDAAVRCRGGGKAWCGALRRWRVTCVRLTPVRGTAPRQGRNPRGRRARPVCGAARCRSLPATVCVAVTSTACPPDHRVWRRGRRNPRTPASGTHATSHGTHPSHLLCVGLLVQSCLRGWTSQAYERYALAAGRPLGRRRITPAPSIHYRQQELIPVRTRRVTLDVRTLPQSAVRTHTPRPLSFVLAPGMRAEAPRPPHSPPAVGDRCPLWVGPRVGR